MMGPDGFSIVCAFNRPATLERYLLPSLREQSMPFEWMGIDNEDGRHPSAPIVLNETARRARYDHLMFVHQDVALGSPHWLADVRRQLIRLRLISWGRCGAVGVAGVDAAGPKAAVTHGDPPRLAVQEPLTRATRVQTLDGCLMIVPRRVFLEQGFDEMTCRGWHLYVADYCLDLGRRGYKMYVLPCPVYHESTGPSDARVYEDARRALVAKHRGQIKTIYATVGVWDTGDAPG